MSMRHLHEDNEEAVEYMGLEFRGKDRAGNNTFGSHQRIDGI